jgi:hypothetical protein
LIFGKIKSHSGFFEVKSYIGKPHGKFSKMLFPNEIYGGVAEKTGRNISRKM